MRQFADRIAPSCAVIPLALGAAVYAPVGSLQGQWLGRLSRPLTPNLRASSAESSQQH